VLAGSLVFMLLLHFLLRNQRQTLYFIGVEIKRQKTKLEKEHAAIVENYTSTDRANVLLTLRRIGKSALKDKRSMGGASGC
jgi:hypothetical protein